MVFTRPARVEFAPRGIQRRPGPPSQDHPSDHAPRVRVEPGAGIGIPDGPAHADQVERLVVDIGAVKPRHAERRIRANVEGWDLVHLQRPGATDRQGSLLDHSFHVPPSSRARLSAPTGVQRSPLQELADNGTP
jgi:hypothetical protein